MSTRSLLSVLALSALAACGGAPAGLTGPVDPACAGAVRVGLAPGETRELTAEQAACFSVASGEYALAGFDARDAAPGGAAGGSAPRYRIADASYGGASARSMAGPSQAVSADGAGPRHVAQSAGAHPAGSPFARTAPWREGERFAVAPLEGSGTVTARVVRIVDGRFALAVVEGDEAGAARVLQQAAEALQYLSREGVPLLDGAFSPGVPTTSAGSGQLLVLAAAWDPDRGAAAAWSAPAEDGAHTFVWLNLNLRPGVRAGYEMYDHTAFRIKVLGHELAHAWQAAWEARSPAGGRAPAWAVEGGADLLAMEMVRRHLRIAEASNWRWHQHLQPGLGSVVYALEPAATEGHLARGYFDASSLLRDLQWRLMRSGVPSAAALAEVSRGAVEGWHGEGCAAGACPGLAGRMRPRLGSGWTPEGAVLLWTLSQAADDRTPNPALANPWYRDAGSPAQGHGWAPAADLRAGSGAAAELALPAGASFHLTLRVPGPEAVFAAGSSVAGSRWMVARLR